MHAHNCMRSTACCRKPYLVPWLSVVACWLNGLRVNVWVRVRAGARECTRFTFFFPLVYKCGEHLCLRWLGIQSP